MEDKTKRDRERKEERSKIKKMTEEWQQLLRGADVAMSVMVLVLPNQIAVVAASRMHKQTQNFQEALITIFKLGNPGAGAYHQIKSVLDYVAENPEEFPNIV